MDHNKDIGKIVNRFGLRIQITDMVTSPDLKDIDVVTSGDTGIVPLTLQELENLVNAFVKIIYQDWPCDIKLSEIGERVYLKDKEKQVIKDLEDGKLGVSKENLETFIANYWR